MKGFYDWKKEVKYQIIIKILETKSFFLTRETLPTVHSCFMLLSRSQIRKSHISDLTLIFPNLESKNYAEIGIFKAQKPRETTKMVK